MNKPPFPMKPGVVLICSNPRCQKERKNDTYGTICEDCYVAGARGHISRPPIKNPRK